MVEGSYLCWIGQLNLPGFNHCGNDLRSGNNALSLKMNHDIGVASEKGKNSTLVRRETGKE